MTSTATDLTIAAWPDCAPRLLRPTQAGPEDLAEYVQGGGYRPLTDPDPLLEQVDLSGLLGRGGAAFPLATKLRTVRDAERRGMRTVIVANGEEGEPASVKDRWLLRHRPHLVLDGLRLAAAIINASRAYVYVSDEQSAAAVNSALSQLDSQTFGATDVIVVTVEPGYVAGEETAAVRRINGGPAKPTDKPPRPFEEGVSGLPTTGEQRRDACQSALHSPARLAELPFGRHTDVAGNVPRDHHGRRQTCRPSTRFPTAQPFSDLLDVARRSLLTRYTGC